MSERPINMSADQVQALLAGKTQHRVVLKDQPEIETIPDGQYVDSYCSERKTPENPRGMSRYWCLWTNDNRQGRDFCKVPWVPGDRLWVRESFSDDLCDYGTYILSAWYWADGSPEYGDWTKPKSSGQMPRRLSRLTLIVTDVRVQRLQEISEADAFAEGCEGWHTNLGHGDFETEFPRDHFTDKWDKQHKRPEHQWDANPWVCALTFRVIHKNIDEVNT